MHRLEPWAAWAVECLEPRLLQTMPLAPGTRLGHYDVTALLGEGRDGPCVSLDMTLEVRAHVVAEDPTALPRGRPGRSLHELE